MHIRLLLEYEGTAYHGWQVQPDGATVQEKLEEAIHTITRETVRARAAGRTDAGVHAWGQVADVRLAKPVEPASLVRGLNAVLPRDIGVLHADEAPEGFNPQTWATEKTYRYVILNRPARTALLRRFAWHVPRTLDADAMREGAKHLVGEHDFSAFRAADCPSTRPVQTMSSVIVEATGGGFLHINATATGFLKHMVRTITGTLVQVGFGRIAPGDVATIRNGRDRTRAGETAPATGLFLVRVRYPDGFGDGALRSGPGGAVGNG